MFGYLGLWVARFCLCRHAYMRFTVFWDAERDDYGFELFIHLLQSKASIYLGPSAALLFPISILIHTLTYVLSYIVPTKYISGHNTTQHNTRQHNTRQDNTRQDKTRQDKTRQDQTGHDQTRQDQTRQDQTRQDKIRQDKTRQDKTRQDKTRQDKTR